MKTVCICGGGSLGHVIGGFLSAEGKARVHLLTGHPENWNSCIEVTDPEGNVMRGHFDVVSSEPSDVIPGADIVLLCVPGYLTGKVLMDIRPCLRPDTFAGGVFASSGFFFEAKRILPFSQPLWGFQRVPFIARVTEYGKSARLLGYKPSLNLAVENVPDRERERFGKWVESSFGTPVKLLANYLEASLTNSNPILHTSRMYSLFGDWTEGKVYDRNFLFYGDWTDEASDILISMDAEFFRLMDKLPVTKGYLPTILDYYESSDARSLTAKLSSIPAFKGIPSPMKQSGGGWVPDFGSRYFTEDFPFVLRYIHQLGRENNVEMPVIEKVYSWGMGILDKNF